jgi:ABC-2 type transport system ATP-binding protein
MTSDERHDDVVTVRGLRKSYGDRAVVEGLDLDVHAGELVGLIGANGAGKTTTVECIQGLRRPDSGVLRVLGCDPIAEAEQLRPMLGSQLQNSALPDRMRVSEAIELFATRRARNTDELLAQFGLIERRRSAFAALSGGERQRLFLVLALVNRPRLVILDELTQGLDPAARRDVWAAVDKLHDDGTSVLLVTHELDEAEVLCGRVIAMRAGTVLDQGTPADLMSRHTPWAQITFPWAGADAHNLERTLSALPGVHTVNVVGSRFDIHGDRQSIAYVGAELVHRGAVPADFSVQLPDLESALLKLLSRPPTAAATDSARVVSPGLALTGVSQ